MGQSEIIIFIVLSNVLLIIFIAGIVLFISKYRNRKRMYEKEKADVEEQHKLDLLHNQLHVQKQTMQFIGSEIHDSVAQKITLAAIYAQKLQFENKDPAILEKLGKVSGILNDSLLELRELGRTLTNRNIQDTGLTALLKMERERVNDSGICKAELQSDFEGEISINVKNCLFRVVQEFIQNSLKHANCNSIKIELASQPNGLSLLLADNGKGFDLHNPDKGGIGLDNMKRRAHMAGGSFDLKSERDKGTSLKLFISSENLLAL